MSLPTLGTQWSIDRAHLRSMAQSLLIDLKDGSSVVSGLGISKSNVPASWIAASLVSVPEREVLAMCSRCARDVLATSSRRPRDVLAM
jgi:hypothetical protein